eukprot:TRINITY_DN4084_c0_g2_i1.p1 TRINITY_DN4084_c0_g2~~TRINITY_DN4084_c0_g2_i1.p1  ORF type:complete len:1042 (+),score=171.35 TRINITY_DN4084_c0_g2_i1:64-3189(+)
MTQTASEQAQRGLMEMAVAHVASQTRETCAAVEETEILQAELQRVNAVRARDVSELAEVCREATQLRQRLEEDKENMLKVQRELAEEVGRLRAELHKATNESHVRGDPSSLQQHQQQQQRQQQALAQQQRHAVQKHEDVWSYDSGLIRPLRSRARTACASRLIVGRQVSDRIEQPTIGRCQSLFANVSDETIGDLDFTSGGSASHRFRPLKSSGGPACRSKRFYGSRPLPEDAVLPVPVTRLATAPCSFALQEKPTIPENDASRLTSGDSSDGELQEEPTELRGKRRGAYSAEVFGAWNEWRATWRQQKYDHNPQDLRNLVLALSNCALFSHVDTEHLDDVARAMPIVDVAAGDCILRQGEEGSSAHVLLDGEAAVYNELIAPSGDAGRRGSFVRNMSTGRVFGEMALLWAPNRTRSVYAASSCRVAELHREVLQTLVVRREMEERELREAMISNLPMMETFSDEQVAQVADALERRRYAEGEVIIRQGDKGSSFFIIIYGSCVASVQSGKDGKDVQEHRRYSIGDMFGERALLEDTTRGATITAKTRVEVVSLDRGKFERMLGSLDQLQKQNYLADPRKSIADFYRQGDCSGPGGACGVLARGTPRSDWFAVYRPTSREAIAKMLNGIAVGKGLNVKGKSAKKNRLSGFVPFLQISNNDHKKDVEAADPDCRLKIFYNGKATRDAALHALGPIVGDEGLVISTPREITLLDDYSTQGAFGIELPEAVVHEAFILKPDISFLVGWETGRVSEPEFMNMNLHAVRSNSTPQVVLYQIDSDNPMNPHGLLIAYAEAAMKPVVSDFDTFTVGSRGATYSTLEPEQAQIATWALQQAESILKSSEDKSWTSRWLSVLRKAGEEGYNPLAAVPRFGFGDRASSALIEAIVRETSSTGAVRHGAECFNFGFPQELDDEYLVVWDGFLPEEGKPWDYLCEDELRGFLLTRIEEGFSFPLNPVWPVRDHAWYEVFEALWSSAAARQNFDHWFPESSRLVERIKDLHAKFPEGFVRRAGDGRSRISMMGDHEGCERTDYICHTVSALRAS